MDSFWTGYVTGIIVMVIAEIVFALVEPTWLAFLIIAIPGGVISGTIKWINDGRKE